MRGFFLPHTRNCHIGIEVQLPWQFNRDCSCRAEGRKVIAEKARWFITSWLQCKERRAIWYSINRSRNVVQLANSRAVWIQSVVRLQTCYATNRNCSVTSENILAKPVSSTRRSSSDPEMKVANSIRGTNGASNHRLILIAPPRALRALLAFS